MKWIIFFLVLVGVESANAMDVSCTNALQTFTYSFFSYSGGAAPAPGMVSSREIWTLQGQPLYRKTTRFSCGGGEESEMCPPSDDIIDADLTTEFVDGTESILWEKNEPWGQMKKYIVQAEIFRPSRKPIPVIGQPRFDDFLICYSESIMRP